MVTMIDRQRIATFGIATTAVATVALALWLKPWASGSLTGPKPDPVADRLGRVNGEGSTASQHAFEPHDRNGSGAAFPNPGVDGLIDGERADGERAVEQTLSRLRRIDTGPPPVEAPPVQSLSVLYFLGSLPFSTVVPARRLLSIVCQ